MAFRIVTSLRMQATSATLGALPAARTRDRQPEVERLRRHLATVEGEIANLLKAIMAGILTASTKAELERAEAEQA